MHIRASFYVLCITLLVSFYHQAPLRAEGNFSHDETPTFWVMFREFRVGSNAPAHLQDVEKSLKEDVNEDGVLVLDSGEKMALFTQVLNYHSHKPINCNCGHVKKFRSNYWLSKLNRYYS